MLLGTLDLEQVKYGLGARMNWVQIIIVILAIGGPAIGRAAQVLGERAKKRQEEKDREQAFESSLRTGRVSSTASRTPQRVSAQKTTASRNEILAQKREELLKKRRQQLQKLKEHQLKALQLQKAQKQASAQRAGPFAESVSKPASSTQPRTSSRAKPAEISTQQVRPQTSQRSPTRKGHRPPARAYQDGPEIHRIDPVGHKHSRLSDIEPFEIHESNLQAHESTLHARMRVSHPRTEDTDSFIADAPRHPFLDMPSTPAAWRRYVIARELFNAPIALRPPGNNKAGMF